MADAPFGKLYLRIQNWILVDSIDFYRFVFIATFSGTEDVVAPHGIPLDLLDRLLIIQTSHYGVNEIYQILKIRASTEGLQIEDDALTALSEIGQSTTLRYAVQLLTPAAQASKVNARTTITKEDITEVNDLFLDVKRSAKFLSEKDNKYMR